MDRCGKIKGMYSCEINIFFLLTFRTGIKYIGSKQKDLEVVKSRVGPGKPLFTGADWHRQ